EVVVEHVGGAVLLGALECLARGGTVVTCGATAGKEVSLNLWPFFVKQHRLVGSYSRNRVDVLTVLDWADTGKLKAVIHGVFPLARTPAAFAALRDRAVLGKVLVNPFASDAAADEASAFLRSVSFHLTSAPVPLLFEQF